MNDAIDYARLTPPPGDGDILIEPPVRMWVALLDRNRHAGQRHSFTLAGHDVRDVRIATRRTLHRPALDQAVIACGHQPAFVHAGVWAKHVVVHHMAGQFGCTAINLIVDNDAPAHPDLVIPLIEDGRVSTRRIVFSSGPAGSAYEGRAGIDAARLATIATAIKTSAVPAGAAFTDYLAAFADDGAADFVDQHTAARRRVDAPLEADVEEIRVSRCFGGPFVADLLLSPGRFAEAYNAALAAYRRRERVRSPDRPLPDLGRDADRVEAALWIYKPLERRRRLWVERSGSTVRLFADQECVGDLDANALARDADASLASLAPWVVRPRALTLTLWARLLACDLFVHGIGGAKYDRVTDDLFRLYYRCEPPAMACVTATLRLPLPRFDASPRDLAAAAAALRDLHYNPQRYLQAAPAELLAGRERLIAESTRLREQNAARIERRNVYLALRELNAALAGSEPGLAGRLTAARDQLRARLDSDAAADSREFFYALQPRARLATLADALRRASALR